MDFGVKIHEGTNHARAAANPPVPPREDPYTPFTL